MNPPTSFSAELSIREASCALNAGPRVGAPVSRCTPDERRFWTGVETGIAIESKRTLVVSGPAHALGYVLARAGVA